MNVNLDVLSVILSFVGERQALLSCMQCSRTLNYAAVKHVLSHYIKIETTRQLLSFSLFMHVGFPVRYRYLRQFDLSNDRWSDTPQEKALDSLLQLLRHAVHLKILKIDKWNNKRDRPGLTEAVAQLKHLECLDISGADPFPSDLILSLESKLTRLDLHFYSARRAFIFDEELSRFCDSLRALTIVGCMSYHGSQHVYTNVTRLSQRGGSVNNLSAFALAQLFPKLSSLVIKFDSDGVRNAALETIRRDNIRQYEEASLPKLSYLRGTPTDLYILGIAHKVTQVEMTDLTVLVTQFVPTILVTMQPLYLSLYVEFYHFTTESLLSLIPAEQSSELRLRWLRLNLYMSGGPYNSSEGILMDGLYQFLGILPVTHLTLIMRCKSRNLFVRETKWERFLNKTTPTSIAMTLAKKMRYLVRLRVEIEGREPVYVEVRRSADETADPILHKLPDTDSLWFRGYITG